MKFDDFVKRRPGMEEEETITTERISTDGVTRRPGMETSVERRPMEDAPKSVETTETPKVETSEVEINYGKIPVDYNYQETKSEEAKPTSTPTSPIVPIPEQKASAAELQQEGAKMKRRADWWEVPTYVDAVERQKKLAEEAAAKDVNRAKRQRNAALITDMADVLGRMVAQSGSNGAWHAPQVVNRAGAANDAYANALRRKDGIAVDYEGKIAQARMQDYLNRKKQEQAEREYGLKVEEAGDGVVDYVPGSHKEEIIDYIPRK